MEHTRNYDVPTDERRAKVPAPYSRWAGASMALLLLGATSALAGNVPCRFKAETESVEVAVFVGGKEHWRDTIPKGETKTVEIPEGAFTVLSQVYNPNLEIKDDIRTDTHTGACAWQVAIPVPLFAQAR